MFDSNGTRTERYAAMGGYMTRDDDTEWAQTEVPEAEAELRRALAARFNGRALPPDLVITTRTAIENREFQAYAAGWRDRGDHDRHPVAESGPTGAKVLPFPHPSGTSPARPHPDSDL